MESYHAILENKNFLDLNPVRFGYSDCLPNLVTDFGIRDYFLLQYIVSGKGMLILNGEEYSVTKKQMFIVPPRVSNYYKADSEEPWSVIWICVKGNMAHQFLELPPVMDFHSNVFIEMMQAKNMDNMREEFLVQKLFELYTVLFRARTTVNHISAVENYIQNEYMNSGISISQIAQALNINHSHLSRLFKKETGISIQQYLTNTRIEKSIALLESGENVQNTALLVGYSDQFNYSRAFKKNIGVSPNVYKQKLKEK